MSITHTMVSKTRVTTPLASLINDGCKQIGGVFKLDYSSAIVLTDDFRKSEAGGVPQGGFLLAAACEQTPEGWALDDEELILLRVRGTEPLPNEAELVQTRLAVVRDAGTTGQGFDDVTDPLTRNELQQSAFNCEVIGTFFTDSTTRGEIEFGADIDNVVSSARYHVFLPSQHVLSWIASFSDRSDDKELLSLGYVRFSSTRRRSREAKIDQASVDVHVSDFVSRKTAVFGMTRTGKSNTIKTLVTAVFQHGAKRGQRIGQLIFDPQGEYANVNQQDGTGLRLLGDGPDQVRIYRFGADRQDKMVLPLGVNFYDVNTLEAVADFVNSIVTEQAGQYAYAKNFTSVQWEEPPTQEIKAHIAWERARIGFYGLLSLCAIRATNFADSGSDNLSHPVLVFTWTKEEFEAFNKEYPDDVRPTNTAGRYKLAAPSAAAKVTTFMAKSEKWNSSSTTKEDYPFKFIADVLQRTSVKAAIRTLQDFHTTHAVDRIEKQIWEDMSLGRLAIVDLSYGATEVSRVISESVVNHLLNEANKRFRSNVAIVPFQIVVEEAHNLFERGAKETARNPWVRLSKEAAKYGIGLVYATQEVSSVDQRILSNTSNWLVAHLNSDNETRELSHYYDFKTWADSLRRAEDIGFVRMKMYSGKYIVPLQVAKFDHKMINDARTAAGLAPISASGESDGLF